MTYVDGFVLPVPKKKTKAYRAIAGKAGRIWREHGALEYRECLLEDARAKGMAAFPRLAGAKAGETVVIAWIVYQSRAHRDRVKKAVMQDPRLHALMTPEVMALFDCRRMAYGGFTVIVDR
jgi:uncharacterized protein YbaA (DUF1428 family)